MNIQKYRAIPKIQNSKRSERNPPPPPSRKEGAITQQKHHDYRLLAFFFWRIYGNAALDSNTKVGFQLPIQFIEKEIYTNNRQ